MYAADPLPAHALAVERFTIHAAPAALTFRQARLHAEVLVAPPAVLVTAYTPFVTGSDSRLQRGSAYDRVEIQRVAGEPPRSIAGTVAYASSSDRTWSHLFTMIELWVPCGDSAAADALAAWLVAPLEGRP